MRKYLLLIAILVCDSFLFSQDPEVLLNQAKDKMNSGELDRESPEYAKK